MIWYPAKPQTLIYRRPGMIKIIHCKALLRFQPANILFIRIFNMPQIPHNNLSFR